MIKVDIVNDELPYRIEIDGHLFGASVSPASAVLVALSVGGVLPADRRKDRKAAASYLFWYFEPTPRWVRLISILENDSFGEATDE